MLRLEGWMGVDHPLLKSDTKIIWKIQYFWMRVMVSKSVRTIKHVKMSGTLTIEDNNSLP